jgi:hypothetical protein
VFDRIRRIHTRPTAPVEVCERCGQVCDQHCRANALLDQARTRAITARLGLQ